MTSRVRPFCPRCNSLMHFNGYKYTKNINQIDPATYLCPKCRFHLMGKKLALMTKKAIECPCCHNIYPTQEDITRISQYQPQNTFQVTTDKSEAITLGA